VCSGFGYGKNKLREGGNQGFWFFRGGKLEHGSGGKILLPLPEGKDHRALVLG
jgi:hypothetical protein